jgi:hypothetical protein
LLSKGIVPGGQDALVQFTGELEEPGAVKVVVDAGGDLRPVVYGHAEIIAKVDGPVPVSRDPANQGGSDGASRVLGLEVFPGDT